MKAPTPHKWAKEIHAWANGADIEFRHKNKNGTAGAWIHAVQPYWEAQVDYRVKPHTITRTVTYPQPLRMVPEGSSKMWLASPEQPKAMSFIWVDCFYHQIRLKSGMCFATQDEAQACHDALFGASDLTPTPPESL